MIGIGYIYSNMDQDQTACYHAKSGLDSEVHLNICVADVSGKYFHRKNMVLV